MNFILFLLLGCVVNLSHAEEQNPLAKVKPLEPHLTYFAIYHSSQRSNELLFTTKTIFLFDNDDLKGVPLYEINNEMIVDNSAAKKEIYLFKDYFHFDKKSQGVIVKDLPFEFIRAGINGYFLGVYDHSGNIASVITKNKKLYFKSSLKELLGNEVSFIKWPTVRESKIVREYFLNEIKINQSLHKIIQTIKSCSDQKDIQCLRLTLKSNDIFFPVYFYNVLKVNHFFTVNSNNGCEKNRRELLNPDSNLYLKNYPEYVPWQFIKSSLSLEKESTSLERTVKKMINKEVISIRVMGNVECVAEEKLQMVLEKDLVTNNWKLLSFNFADTLSEE